MIFDPFENRRCRDIRNTLGHCFVKAVQARDIALFHAEIPQYPPEETPAPIAEYIRHRTDFLKKVLDQMTSCSTAADDYDKISLILWNLELFFECHEWLEIKWRTARGKRKKALQALILAAVTYEQLTYGRNIPAQKVAEKALLLFKQYRDFMPEAFDIDLFITKLTDLDPVPPKFSLPQ